MKFLLCVFFIVATFVSGSAQIFASARPMDGKHVVSPLIVQSGQRIQYRIPGLRMRKTGTILTVVGGAFMVGAVAVYNNGDPNKIARYNSDGSVVTDEDEHHLLGGLMFFIGTSMTVPGAILWIKGAQKYNHNTDRQAAIRLRPTGLAFSYKF